MVSEKVQSALKQIEGLEGQYIGNGQCYALSAKYSQLMGGCGLGAGVTGLSDVIGDTTAAANIGSGFNWKGKGWSVKFNPSAEDLKNASGAIINYKANQGAPLYTSWAGHTGVLLNVSGDQIITMEQNGWPTRYCHKYTRNLGQVQPTVSSICLPPGAGGNGTSSGGSSSGSSSSQGSYGVLHVNNFRGDERFVYHNVLTNAMSTLASYTDQIFNRKNPNYSTFDEKSKWNAANLKKIKELKSKGIAYYYNQAKHNFTELQMLAQDITQIKLIDGFGDSYELYPLRFDTTSESYLTDAGVLNLTGGMGQNSEVTLKPVFYDNYSRDASITYSDKNPTPKAFTKKVMDDTSQTGKTSYWYGDGFNDSAKNPSINLFSAHMQTSPDLLSRGLTDRTPKALPIIDDSTASYMQSNRNQIQAKRTNFNEQSTLIGLQSKQRLANATLANNQATFGSNYALQTQQYVNDTQDRNNFLGMADATVSGVSSVLGSKSIGGLLMNGAGAGLGMASAYYKGVDANAMNGMKTDYLRGMAGFTAQANQLRSTDAQLANMQAKMGIQQAIRSFNASLADLGDQPDTLQQAGDDINNVYANKMAGYYTVIKMPEPNAFKQIYSYVRDYGSRVNTYVVNIQTAFTNRKRFNYIKVTDIDLSSMEIPQHYKDSLKNVFISGTRFWNSDAINNSDSNIFNTEIDNVDMQGEQPWPIGGFFSGGTLKEFDDSELSDIGLFRKYHKTLIHFRDEQNIKVSNSGGEVDDEGRAYQVDCFIPFDSYWEVDSGLSRVTLLSPEEKSLFESTNKGKFKTIEISDNVNFVNEEDIANYKWSYGTPDATYHYSEKYPLTLRK